MSKSTIKPQNKTVKKSLPTPTLKMTLRKTSSTSKTDSITSPSNEDKPRERPTTLKFRLIKDDDEQPCSSKSLMGPPKMRKVPSDCIEYELTNGKSLLNFATCTHTLASYALLSEMKVSKPLDNFTLIINHMALIHSVQIILC